MGHPQFEKQAQIAKNFFHGRIFQIGLLKYLTEDRNKRGIGFRIAVKIRLKLQFPSLSHTIDKNPHILRIPLEIIPASTGPNFPQRVIHDIPQHLRIVNLLAIFPGIDFED